MTTKSESTLVARMGNARTLVKVLEALKDLLDDATFRCTQAGMLLQAMDKSHVALVNLELQATSFEHYVCSKELVLGFNMAQLIKLMKISKPEDSVTLEADVNANVLTVLFQGARGTNDAKYDLKLSNLPEEYLGIPDTNYNCEIEMPSVEFSRVMKHNASLGDYISMVCVPNSGITFSALDGPVVGGVRFSHDPALKVEMRIEEHLNLRFIAKFICKFAAASSFSPSVKIMLSREDPMTLQYNVESPDGFTCGVLRYFLAPLVDDQ